jgi:hypothetical protein
MVLHAMFYAPVVERWLTNTCHPRILHIFDRACNLINEHGDVLSIVTPHIGNGPFNLVLEDEICFLDFLQLESQVSVSPTQFTLGNLHIHITDAKRWNPCPDWKKLHDHRQKIAHQIAHLQITNYQFSDSLSASLTNADLSSSLTAARQLAGLGIGLTPAGDDFIMGALYAAWIIHPPEVASALAQAIANTAAPLTTSLSAAWLRAAGRGEVGELWHAFFNALLIADSSAIQLEVVRLFSIGHTSGADALTGFMSMFEHLSTMP